MRISTRSRQGAVMARFVQIIEFQSFRNPDVQWEDAGDAATA